MNIQRNIDPKTLKATYDWNCYSCSQPHSSAPSLFMELGVNTASEKCEHCGAENHLAIQGDRMVAEDLALYKKPNRPGAKK